MCLKAVSVSDFIIFACCLWEFHASYERRKPTPLVKSVLAVFDTAEFVCCVTSSSTACFYADPLVFSPNSDNNDSDNSDDSDGDNYESDDSDSHNYDSDDPDGDNYDSDDSESNNFDSDDGGNSSSDGDNGAPPDVGDSACHYEENSDGDCGEDDFSASDSVGANPLHGQNINLSDAVHENVDQHTDLPNDIDAHNYEDGAGHTGAREVSPGVAGMANNSAASLDDSTDPCLSATGSVGGLRHTDEDGNSSVAAGAGGALRDENADVSTSNLDNCDPTADSCRAGPSTDNGGGSLESEEFFHRNDGVGAFSTFASSESGLQDASGHHVGAGRGAFEFSPEGFVVC